MVCSALLCAFNKERVLSMCFRFHQILWKRCTSMSILFNTNQQCQCSSCLVSYLLGLKYFSNKFRPNSGKCRVHGSIFKINKIHDSRATDLDPVCVFCRTHATSPLLCIVCSQVLSSPYFNC